MRRALQVITILLTLVFSSMGQEVNERLWLNEVRHGTWDVPRSLPDRTKLMTLWDTISRDLEGSTTGLEGPYVTGA